MVNEEILGALNSALARGESLKKAMMTLYNAGYKKEEISEAARSVQEFTPATQPQTPQKVNQPIDTKMLAPTKKLTSKNEQPSAALPQQAQQQISPQQMQQQPQGSQIPQKVSGYGQPPKPAGKAIIIVLGFLLLILIGILATIFLFKEDLINFFNNLFS